MTETAEPRDPAAPPTDSERDEDWALLGSVLPVIPPDQTPGIEGVRSLEDGEVVQFEQDAVLLTAIAGSATLPVAISCRVAGSSESYVPWPCSRARWRRSRLS